METNRIKMKIGDAEFEAEGPSEIINAQFEAFLQAVSSLPKATAAVAVVPSPSVTAAIIPPLPMAPSAGISPEILSRVFRDNGNLSLAALPHGENKEAAAMLALLYGFLKLKNENAVTGTALMKSAKISGVNFDRVDRVMSSHQPDYVLAAGVKKARRYQLNNRGIAKAEEIINALLQ